MKNKSIRILCAAALCLAMLFSLAACGTSSPANSQLDPNSEPVQDNAEHEADPEAAAKEPESAEPVVYTIRFDLNTTADPSDDELYRYEESGYDVCRHCGPAVRYHVRVCCFCLSGYALRDRAYGLQRAGGCGFSLCHTLRDRDNSLCCHGCHLLHEVQEMSPGLSRQRDGFPLSPRNI